MSHAHAGHNPQDGLTAETVFDRAYWEDRYRSKDAVWSGNPNPQLVADASALAPGTALDIGCGEGADAIWLAGRGWRVVATDISSVALERAAAHAEAKLGPEAAGRISWQQADLVTETLPEALQPGAYDLVTAQFIHLPPDRRRLLHRRLAQATAPGGTLLVVGHHPSDLETTVLRPDIPQLFFTGTDVAAVLGDGWTVLADDVRPRTVKDPEGRPATIHDAVLTARRAPAAQG